METRGEANQERLIDLPSEMRPVSHRQRYVGSEPGRCAGHGDLGGEKRPEDVSAVAFREGIERLHEQASDPIGIVDRHRYPSDIAKRSRRYRGDGSLRKTGRAVVRSYRSTSPTTKKIDPRIAIRSGTSMPGNIAGITLTFENDAVRIFRRYGCFFPSPTR